MINSTKEKTAKFSWIQTVQNYFTIKKRRNVRQLDLLFWFQYYAKTVLMRYHKRKAQLKSCSFPRTFVYECHLWIPPFPGGDNLSGECCMCVCVYEQGWSCIGPLHPYCPYRSTQAWNASLISVPDCPENTRIRKKYVRGSGPRICSLFQWHTVCERKEVMQVKNVNKIKKN